ncbi:peptide-methionine (S)-S-oxide reductase [Flavobacterium sp. K5-23]|nr:peptide-methionine (S)-S-oxide reductase [Flavobacterium sp. K5-23]
MTEKIGLGGGCHWCTEAVFQSLIGVEKVEQGWIASNGNNESFSEAVIIHFDASKISLEVLIEIHLHTHKSTVKHSMREKYRSAIYFFNLEQQAKAKTILSKLQPHFKNEIITTVMPFLNFKASREEILNYYYKNPEKPFCKNYIDPKLKILLEKFSKYTAMDKINSSLKKTTS